MRTKDGTVMMELHPYLTGYLFELDRLHHHKGGEVTITSGSEPGGHAYTSLHHAIPGCAADIRNWELVHWSSTQQFLDAKIVADDYCRDHPMLQPGDIDVVHEGVGTPNAHIHAELQPKRR